MKKSVRLSPKDFTYRLITFFLLIPIFLNLFGNMIGIISSNTFFDFGYNIIAIISRLIIGDSVDDVNLRIFFLALLTIAGSAFVYFLYHHAKKGNVPIFIVAILLYFGDFVLGLSSLYNEQTFDLDLSMFIHVVMFAYLLVTTLAHLLVNPVRNKEYDYA